MKIPLRVLLTLTLLLLTAVPVAMFGFWAEQTTLEREYQRVQESHLQLAKTTTQSLRLYSLDLKAVFRLLGKIDAEQRSSPEIVELATGLHFTEFQILAPDMTLLSGTDYGDGAFSNRLAAPQSILNVARKKTKTMEVLVHPAKLNPDGAPRIFLSMPLEKNEFALAAVSLEYIQLLQSSIRFGQSGHSAIVDQAGNVLAHPVAEWANENRNIAGLKPIVEMIQGKSGVIEFYSPATKQQMITGYAITPEVGWGVMVPQTLAEIESVANKVLTKLWSVLVIGVLISALVAWWLAGWIIKPLQRITDTANRMNEGELNARVLPFVTVPAREFKVLGLAFDNMAQSLQNNNAKLQVKLESQQLEEMGKSTDLPSKGRVLVIDDSAVSAQQMTGWLSKAGYTTFSALNNEESLKIAAVMRPDLAIVSVQSSVDGGFSHRRKLINLLGGVEIPVIAIFPSELSRQEKENKDVNVIAAIDMPVTETRLLNLINDIRQTSEWKMLDVKFT